MGINLSPKHGVNPVLLSCFFCGGDAGLMMVGKVSRKKLIDQMGIDPSMIDGHGDDVTIRGRICDGSICSRCEEVKEKAIFIVQVRDGEEGERKNPFRTGKMVAIKEEAAERMFQPAFFEAVKKSRMAYCPESAWRNLGLDEATKGMDG